MMETSEIHQTEEINKNIYFIDTNLNMFQKRCPYSISNDIIVHRVKTSDLLLAPLCESCIDTATYYIHFARTDTIIYYCDRHLSYYIAETVKHRNCAFEREHNFRLIAEIFFGPINDHY